MNKDGRRPNYATLRKLTEQTVMGALPEFGRDVASTISGYTHGMFECGCHSTGTSRETPVDMTTSCSFVRCESNFCNTGDGFACQHCASICHCGKIHCPSCASQRWLLCSTCSNFVCPECHGKECDMCSKQACEIQECRECHCDTLVCLDCSLICSACLSVHCAGCSGNWCQKCNRYLCNECLENKHCSKCGEMAGDADNMHGGLNDKFVRKKHLLCFECADTCNVCDVVLNFKCQTSTCEGSLVNENLAKVCLECKKRVCTTCVDTESEKCKTCISNQQPPVKKLKL